MSETKRTILLLVLLFIILGFIWWVEHNYHVNFESTL